MARTADPAVRTALIEAAAQILATDGLGALSLRKVANQVGTSTMAVYTHFAGKDELVQEIVREAFARLAAEIARVPHTDDALADLQEVGWAYRRNALANAHLYRVMFGLNPLHLADPAQAGGQEIGLDAFGQLVTAVARCVDAGTFADEPVDIALQFWGLAHGVVSLELAGFLGDHGAATFGAACASIGLGFTIA